MSDNIQIEIGTPGTNPKEEVDLLSSVSNKSKEAKEVKEELNVTLDAPVNPKKV